MNPTTSIPSGFAPALRRGAWILGLAALAAMFLMPAGGQAARGKVLTIAPETPLVTLLSVKSVHQQPIFGSPSVAGLADQRPITLVRTSLPILGSKVDAEGRGWLKVRLPGRVFHRKTPPPTGWITAFDTKLSTTPWHLVVSTRMRRVTVYYKGRSVKAFKVIVGKPATPTPRGEYFIEETMRLPAKHLEAPGALATSARSHVLKEFMGGPGQIALHGVKNIGGTMGTAVSNGCIRMTSDAIMWLERRVAAGVPLTIV